MHNCQSKLSFNNSFCLFSNKHLSVVNKMFTFFGAHVKSSSYNILCVSFKIYKSNFWDHTYLWAYICMPFVWDKILIFFLFSFFILFLLCCTVLLELPFSSSSFSSVTLGIILIQLSFCWIYNFFFYLYSWKIPTRDLFCAFYLILWILYVFICTSIVKKNEKINRFIFL